MCPGRPNVSGVEVGSAKARIVAARSVEDTHVLHHYNFSMVKLKVFPNNVVLFVT